MVWCYAYNGSIPLKSSKYARYLQFLRKREQLELVDLIVGYFNNFLWL